MQGNIVTTKRMLGKPILCFVFMLQGYFWSVSCLTQFSFLPAEQGTEQHTYLYSLMGEIKAGRQRSTQWSAVHQGQRLLSISWAQSTWQLRGARAWSSSHASLLHRDILRGGVRAGQSLNTPRYSQVQHLVAQRSSFTPKSVSGNNFCSTDQFDL